MNPPTKRKNVCIDYDKVRLMQSGEDKSAEIFSEFIAVKDLAYMPALDKLLISLDSGDSVSPELQKEMLDAVKRLYDSDIHEIASIKKEKEELGIEQSVANISDGQFRLEKVLAKALIAIDEGKDTKEIKNIVQSSLDDINKVLSGLNVKDFHRDKIILNINGEVYTVSSAKELKELFPELTGEQAGYIAALGNQSLIASAGSLPLQQLTIKDMYDVKEKHKAQSVTRSVHIGKDGVKVVSSKEFRVANLKDKGVIMQIAENPDAELPSIRTSLVVDISSLTGDEFSLGSSKGAKVRQYVESLDQVNDKIVFKMREAAAKHGAVEKSESELVSIRKDILSTLKSDSGVQASIAKGDKRTLVETEKLRKPTQDRESLKEQFGPLLFKIEALNATEPAFLAERMALEYQKGSDLWNSWSLQNKFSVDDKENKQITPEDLLKLKIQIVGIYEKDKQKQIEYASEKLATFTRKLTPDIVIGALSPITPENKIGALEKNAESIAKAASDGWFNRKSLEDKTSKIKEKIGVTIAPEVTAKNIGRKLTRQISAPSLGKKEKKNEKEFKRSQSSLGP